MDGNITAEGITADLEAMQRVGIGGVILMDITHDNPPGQVACLSPEWLRLVCHAISEAARFDLRFSINNGPGWSGSGGPDTPTCRCRNRWSTTNITGPAIFGTRTPHFQPTRISTATLLCWHSLPSPGPCRSSRPGSPEWGVTEARQRWQRTFGNPRLHR